MSNYKTVKSIQDNTTKQDVREVLNDTIIKFAKQTKQNIKLLSLPSTEWKQEKGLISLCKENKIKINIVGVENRSEPEVVEAFLMNAPKEAIAKRGEFNEVAKHYADKGFNVIYGDYCGNPAEAIFNAEINKTRYSYPHIRLFKDIVTDAKHPMLYFMTFSCNGRILGGAESMKKALSPLATNVPSAIRHKISQTLSTYGLNNKASRIFSVYYHGAGKHFMITIGVAINFTPKFDAIKENWVKKNKAIKAVSSYIKVDYVGLKKEAIKALSDAGWTTENIAHALNTQNRKVGSVLAWHKNRSSWDNKKVA